MIKYTIEYVTTDVTVGCHQDGSVKVNINVGSKLPDMTARNIIVEAHLNDPVMQIALSHTMEALRHQFPNAKFMLDMPYTPYARQDRRCNPGEAVGIKVFGDYINSLDFTAVIITDPHSIACELSIDKAQVVPQTEAFEELHDFGGWYIVAPDLGAMKKAEAFAKATQALGVLTCYKERNLYTGDITSQGVIGGEDIPEGSRFFVIDDICDGGRTFVGVHALLQKFKPELVHLAVTHGIFSYGESVVTDIFDHVYTTNSYNPDRKSSEKLTVIKV